MMSKRFRVSGLLWQKLEELSLSPEAVLRQADLSCSLCEQEKCYLSTEELFGLWRSIETLAGEPGIALKIGSEDRIERYDPVAITSLYTRSFREAMQRAARYKQLTCPEKIEMRSSSEECCIRFLWTKANELEPPMLADLCFAWLLSIGRRGTGLPLSPLRVEYARRESSRDVFERHFGCPVLFGASSNAIVFRQSDLDLPFITYNPDLLAAISPQLENELAIQRSQVSVQEQVKTTLKRVLAGRRPDIKDVAKEVGQSTRTLQRRLKEGGVTYQQVLEDARRELAHHYLIHSNLELNETAYLLGYEDASSFFRAFQNWEGLPPGRWREQRLSAAPVAS